MKHWSLDDIPWNKLDRSKADSATASVVKAAALVEYNGADYATYLRQVFHDDDAFCALATDWAADEIRHGEALGRWAELVDPTFDFAAAVAHFRAGYALPQGAGKSVRGSRSGELVARCVVEAGTSSFYSALRDHCDEPALKAIASRIAADEFRHYKLFYTTLQRYDGSERVGRWRKLAVALGRLNEVDDDELAFAYHCGNRAGLAYDRKRCNADYAGRAYGFYRYRHCERAANMCLKAAGLTPQGTIAGLAGRALWRVIRRKVDTAAAPA